MHDATAMPRAGPRNIAGGRRVVNGGYWNLLPDRRCLQARSAFLHVDRELHALASVTLDERIAVLLERLLELLEREAVGRLTAFALRADELLVNCLPLGRRFASRGRKVSRLFDEVGR